MPNNGDFAAREGATEDGVGTVWLTAVLKESSGVPIALPRVL